MVTPPDLTEEQRRVALEKAARARRLRAEVKERLKIGVLTLRELLDEIDGTGEDAEVLGKLKVVSMLESLPGVGKVRARQCMREFEISETRRLRGLGPNQRRALLSRFG
ncbi:MAG: integration host factor, actinobacterial type [Actinomycetota bacterium]